jgi:hypothetical protein
MAHLDAVNPQPPQPPGEPGQGPVAPPPPTPPVEPWRVWSFEPSETREVRKAKERADRAARRADRAARRLHDARERAAGRSGARQLVDAAGDAATAALTAVSAAADEAQARLAAKARMRELEHAVVSARAGAPVEVTPPTREEALKLADRIEPGSSQASTVRGLAFILAGIAAFAMIQIGGFGWLGFFVPFLIIIAGGSVADRVRAADRSRIASNIQVELARASLGARQPGLRDAIAQEVQPASGAEAPAVAGVAVAERPRLLENGDPRTRAEVLAVLDRLIANVAGQVPDTDVATLGRIRESAALALPATDDQLDLTNHDLWLLRQICIDYVPRALDHFIALPAELAAEPLLDGRSARQVLDEQLTLIETRLDEMAARSYQREAGGLLTHARYVADSLRPDPFHVRLAELATNEAQSMSVAPEPVQGTEQAMITEPAITRERERERA